MLNAFTVDVEDYYQVSAFEKDVPRDHWGRFESRVVDNTHRVLALLDRFGVKATFFVLGWVAREHPQLVRGIHDRGHEVASHGYWHRLIYRQSPEEFRDDLRRSRDAIEGAIDHRVVAYRAPSFSITRQSRWALDILAEEGFQVDSSIFPTRHPLYGIPGAEPSIHRIDTSAGPLWEFPPAVIRFVRMNLPVSGGGYFRLYPVRWSVRWLASLNRKHGRPFVFYIHPWELDPGQPRIQAGSRWLRAKHYLNLASTEKRLEVLLERFRFGRLGEVVGAVRDRRHAESTTDAATHCGQPACGP